MTRFLSARALALTALQFLLCACQGGGVGDPCVPEEEYSDTFSGFSVNEVNFETKSFQCETRLCLVNHFQGRVSCPYGQTEEQAASDPRCQIPGTRDPIRRPVNAQLLERRPEKAVYCSCRCDGPDKQARYCDCPDGYVCSKLAPEFTGENAQLGGSYCILDGTQHDRERPNLSAACDRSLANCD